MLTLIIIFTSITLALLIRTIAFFLSYSSLFHREKASPFECGFDPKKNARIPFSTRFFLLAVIFLVFDVEIVLLIPLPSVFLSMAYSSILLSGFIFTFILLVGLIHEWHEGSLSWSNYINTWGKMKLLISFWGFNSPIYIWPFTLILLFFFPQYY